MKLWLSIFVLFFSVQLFSQEIIEFHWGTNRDLPDLVPAASAIPLTHWQMQNDAARKLTVPFVIAGVTNVELQTTFPAVRDDLSDGYALFSQGITGSAVLYFNGHLISVIGNGQQPFKINLPAEFFNEDSLQSLTIRLRQPQTTAQGFPILPYTYSESHAIGLSAPLYIVKKPSAGIDRFTQKLEITPKKALNLSYSYRIFFRSLPKRIQIEERFVNQKTGNTIFRKLRFSKDITRSSINIKGKFPISRADLWSPDSPQTLRLELTVTFFGKQKSIVQKVFTFGARSFRFTPRTFLLNNQPIAVHGMSYHQNFHRWQGKSAYEQIKNDLERIKALGNNSVRVMHVLPNDLFFRLADSLGLLVFAEMPIWRFPSSFFSENYLLEMAKANIAQLAPFFSGHPSFVALGLGQEIPVHDPVAQKFIFILNGKAKSLLDVQTYISPIPGHPLPPEKVADFYVYDHYSPVDVLNTSLDKGLFGLIGKIGILTPKQFQEEEKAKPDEINRTFFLKEEISNALLGLKINSGFVESYQDWFSPFPSLVAQTSSHGYIIPQGFYTVNGEAKPWIKLLNTPLWQTDETAVAQKQTARAMPTNFFSILITAIMVIFFSFYRRTPRLKENLKRSLRHSYGFFVDLRERRIIPLFNSVFVGFVFSVILAAFIAAQVYFNHSSYWLQEIMAVFFVPLNLFEYYLSISQSYWLLTLVLFLFFFLLPVLGAITLKIVSLFMRTKIRLRQGLAVMFWSGTPFLWFFPVSLISYHWIFYHQNMQILWIIFLFFFLWVHLRLINAIHILFIVRSSTVLVFLLLCYSIPLLIFWALFNPPGYWFDYFKLLMDAKALF